MTCKYCVIRHDDNPSEGCWLAIHQVFYDESGEIVGYNQEPESCSADRFDDLVLQQDLIRLACDQEVLFKSKLDARISKRLRRSEPFRRHLIRQAQ